MSFDRTTLEKLYLKLINTNKELTIELLYKTLSLEGTKVSKMYKELTENFDIFQCKQCRMWYSTFYTSKTYDYLCSYCNDELDVQ